MYKGPFAGKLKSSASRTHMLTTPSNTAIVQRSKPVRGRNRHANFHCETCVGPRTKTRGSKARSKSIDFFLAFPFCFFFQYFFFGSEVRFLAVFVFFNRRARNEPKDNVRCVLCGKYNLSTRSNGGKSNLR